MSPSEAFSINVKPFVVMSTTFKPFPFTLLIIVEPFDLLVKAFEMFNTPLPPWTIIVSPFVVKVPEILISSPFTSL